MDVKANHKNSPGRVVGRIISLVGAIVFLPAALMASAYGDVGGAFIAGLPGCVCAGVFVYLLVAD